MSLWVEVLLLFSLLLVNRLAFIYIFNKRLHLSLSKNPALSFLYFVGMGIGVAILFWDYAVILFMPSVISVMTFLTFVTVVNPWIYDRLQDLKKMPKKLARANPDQQFLLIDDRFLLAKTGDVLFQQTVAGILILIMTSAGIPFETLVPIFAGIFFLIHLHMFLSTRIIWALYFSIFAALGGFVLPFLILTVEGGIYYALALHMMWYVGSGAFFGFLENDAGAKAK